MDSWKYLIKKANFYIAIDGAIILAIIFEILYSGYYILLNYPQLNTNDLFVSAISILSLIVVYLIFSILSYRDLMKAFAILAKEKNKAGILGNIGGILLTISGLATTILLVPSLSFLLLEVLIAVLFYLGYLFIGLSFYTLAKKQNNGLFNLGAILYMIPIIPISQILGSILIYLSL